MAYQYADTLDIMLNSYWSLRSDGDDSTYEIYMEYEDIGKTIGLIRDFNVAKYIVDEHNKKLYNASKSVKFDSPKYYKTKDNISLDMETAKEEPIAVEKPTTTVPSETNEIVDRFNLIELD